MWKEFFSRSAGKHYLTAVGKIKLIGERYIKREYYYCWWLLGTKNYIHNSLVFSPMQKKKKQNFKYIQTSMAAMVWLSFLLFFFLFNNFCTCVLVVLYVCNNNVYKNEKNGFRYEWVSTGDMYIQRTWT